MAEPRTEAGRTLLNRRCNCGYIPSYDAGHDLRCVARINEWIDAEDILAIEAEARADALREAREAVEAVSGELDGNAWDGTRVVIAREDALAALDALPSGTSS